MFQFSSYALDAKFYLPLILLFASCAQPVVPTGGSKDEIAPRISKVTISRGTSTTIRLSFDENISTDLPAQRIIISPAIPGKPSIKTVQLGLVIHIDTIVADTFQLQILRSAINDINEKNPLNDTIIYFHHHNCPDSISQTYYHSGKILSSYNLEELKDISVYKGVFPQTPQSLVGYHYTKTDKDGHFVLPSFDTTLSQLLLLKDLNNNHQVDSGESFHVLKATKPKFNKDTSYISYLTTDLPNYTPVAERVYFGYRIFGFKGYSLHQPNDLPTVSSYLTNRPLATVNDTIYMVTDTLESIPFRPLYTQLKSITPKKTTTDYSVNFQIFRNPGIQNRYHIAYSKPLLKAGRISTLSEKDTLPLSVDLSSQAPFLATIDLPSDKYLTISIPDSSVQFTDLSFLNKQLISIPRDADSVSVTFRRAQTDTAYYLIRVQSKKLLYHIALDEKQVSFRLPVDTYNFLIFHDADRNGFITPAKASPFRAQEYHYSLPAYLLRKGIDTEETVQPQ